MTDVPIRRIAAILAVGLACVAARCARAGGGPENLFLVVNGGGAASKEVANHYIALRRVPAANVFYLGMAPGPYRMTGMDFREKLLKPILAEIDKRGFGHAQIDHIVYSCDFPWQIDFSKLIGAPAAAGPTVSSPAASLTGATYLYQSVVENPPQLTELNSNFYFSRTDAPAGTRAFSAFDQWSPTGERVMIGGRKYMLATQLGCSQPEGNTTAEMVSYLTRAAGADGKRLPGTFYFMKNKNVRSTTREPGFASAVEQLRKVEPGVVKAQVVNGEVPEGRRDILGLTSGSTHIPLRASGCLLLPGALVDNFTSFGGYLHRLKTPNPQTRISEYLRAGAAGAAGTVVEPFALAEKFPTPALHVHYARGSSLAEAYYQAVQAPYQLLVLGDPLCQPWAMVPKVTVDDVANGAPLSGTVELSPAVKTIASRKVSRVLLFVDGTLDQEHGADQSFTLDTTKLADGYHELRIVAVDDSPVETQGRWIADVMVKNGRDALSIATTVGARIKGATVPITVTSTIEGTTIVTHNGQELGRVTGRRGVLEAPTEKLGKGPVEIVAHTTGTTELRSPPLRLVID